MGSPGEARRCYSASSTGSQISVALVGAHGDLARSALSAPIRSGALLTQLAPPFSSWPVGGSSTPPRVSPPGFN